MVACFIIINCYIWPMILHLSLWSLLHKLKLVNDFGKGPPFTIAYLPLFNILGTINLLWITHEIIYNRIKIPFTEKEMQIKEVVKECGCCKTLSR